MTKRTEENPTYDYNIYRIGIQKADEFKEFLMERRFEEIPLKDSMLFEPNGFSFELMFCDKENKKRISMGKAFVRMFRI